MLYSICTLGTNNLIDSRYKSVSINSGNSIESSIDPHPCSLLRKQLKGLRCY